MHAFIVRGPNRSLLFLPDHDRWATTLAFHGSSSIRSWLNSMEVDIALIDGTFWSADELSGRNQDEVRAKQDEITLTLTVHLASNWRLLGE